MAVIAKEEASSLLGPGKVSEGKTPASKGS